MRMFSGMPITRKKTRGWHSPLTGSFFIGRWTALRDSCSKGFLEDSRLFLSANCQKCMRDWRDWGREGAVHRGTTWFCTNLWVTNECQCRDLRGVLWWVRRRQCSRRSLGCSTFRNCWRCWESDTLIYYNIMKKKGIIILLCLAQIMTCGFPSAMQLYRSEKQLE